MCCHISDAQTMSDMQLHAIFRDNCHWSDLFMLAAISMATVIVHAGLLGLLVSCDHLLVCFKAMSNNQRRNHSCRLFGRV